MSRLILLLFMPLVAVFISASAPVFVAQASAVDIFKNTCSSDGTTISGSHVCSDVNKQGTDNNPIIRILRAAIVVVSYIAGVAAIIGIVVSGLRLILSGGDANAAASARTGLVYSLIGVAVVALAQLIVIFVIDRVKF
jgi:hypothetical protein